MWSVTPLNVPWVSKATNVHDTHAVSGPNMPSARTCLHPGGNPGANLNSTSHRCYLREAIAFEWELTKEAIDLPLVRLQGVGLPRHFRALNAPRVRYLIRRKPPISLRYRGTSLIRKHVPVGPYSRTMPRALWWSQGGGALSYVRGTSVWPTVGELRNETPEDFHQVCHERMVNLRHN